jgi:hypothetical protein
MLTVKLKLPIDLLFSRREVIIAAKQAPVENPMIPIKGPCLSSISETY